MPLPRPSRSRAGRRVPLVVVAAVVAFAALGAVWSVAVPLGEGPDEPAHLALVLHLAAGHAYPDFDGLQSPVSTNRLCRTYAAATRACPRPGEAVTPTSTRRHPAADAPDKGRRPAWDDGDGARPVGALNQMPQHPPLYYQAMALVLRAERAVLGQPLSLDRELALLRLVNVLLVAPLPLLAWWAARRLGADDAVGSVAAVAVVALPQLTSIGSQLNNDNLLTLLGGILIALLAGVAMGDRRPRTAVLVGLVTGLALLTKAFAVVFPPVVVLAYLVGARLPRDRRAGAADTDTRTAVEAAPGSGVGVGVGGAVEVDGTVDGTARRGIAWRSALALLAGAGGVAITVAAWWFLRSYRRTGSFAPTIEDQRYTSALQPPGFEPHLPDFLSRFVGLFLERFWGSFGWYTVRIPGWLTVTLSLLAVALLVEGIAAGVRVAGRRRRGPLLVVLAPTALLAVFVLVRAWDLHVTTGQYPFIQGRYLFAGLVGSLAVVAVGLTRWVGRWALLSITTVALGLQAEALRRVVAGYWGGPGLGPRGQLRALAAWSGWPGELVAVFGVTAAAAVGWLVFAVAADLAGSRSRSGPVEGPPVASDVR